MKKPSLNKGKGRMEQKSSSSKEEDTMDEKKWLRAQVRATWAIAIFTIVLAVFTGMLVRVASQQYWWFKLSERPWVGPVERAIGRDTQGRIGALNWGYVNGGKTTAKNVRTHLFLKIGDPIPRSPTEIRSPVVEGCGNDDVPLPGKNGLIVMPGVKHTYNAWATPDVVDSAASIGGNRVGLYFVGCLDYEGQSGEHHRTYVCEYYSRTADRFELCPYGAAASY